MQHLKGVGVSPGVVSGRAVILIQREQVLRYCIGARRIPHEIERLEASRARARQQLTDIRESVSERRGRELASIFDAQLAMLDDPMLVPRAAEIIRDQRRQRRLGDRTRIRGIQRPLRRDRGFVSPGAEGGPGRRRRAAGDEPQAGPVDAGRFAARAGRSVSSHRGRADAVSGGPGRLDKSPRVRDRRRQPYVSHGHSRAVSRRGGGRRAARRQPHHPARSACGHRRRSGRGHRRAWRGDARAGVAPFRRSGAGAGGGASTDGAGVYRRRRSDPARREHRVSRRSRLGALRGSRGNRAVSIRVPPDRPMARRRPRAGGRKPAVRASIAGCSKGWRRDRSPSARSTWTRINSRVHCPTPGRSTAIAPDVRVCAGFG